MSEEFSSLVKSVDPVSRRAMNSTAYRIFRLLQWLIQTPLTVEAMNKRFCLDPLIGKPVSNDSIWLYINTLKLLGCRISRPSPKNGFQYEMTSHPFALTLTEANLEMLSKIKTFAQQCMSRQEMQALDALLKKIVAFTDCPDRQERVEQLFARSRSFDLDNMKSQLTTLEEAIQSQDLVQLIYLSPQQGEESFSFLPTALFYEHGLVYVRGERSDFTQPATLRADRIQQAAVLEDTELKTLLLSRQTLPTEITIRLFVPDPTEFSGFGLGENQGVYQETHCWQPESRSEDGKSFQAAHLKISLRIRESFFLKQQLLACGYPFQVVSPEPFREEMRQTLKVMRSYYQASAHEKQAPVSEKRVATHG